MKLLGIGNILNSVLPEFPAAPANKIVGVGNVKIFTAEG